MIDEYGADALRFTLAAMAAHKVTTSGFGPQRCRRQPQFRNQAVECRALRRDQWMRATIRISTHSRQGDAQSLDRSRDREERAGRSWRRSRLTNSTMRRARSIVFVWNVYCDWYLELIKPVLTGPDGAAKNETRAAAAWALDEILKLLHPFMPFITRRAVERHRRARAAASPHAGARRLGRRRRSRRCRGRS